MHLETHQGMGNELKRRIFFENKVGKFQGFHWKELVLFKSYLNILCQYIGVLCLFSKSKFKQGKKNLPVVVGGLLVMPSLFADKAYFASL